MNPPPPLETDSSVAGDTGLPGLHTWLAVYVAVGGISLFWVTLLTALSWWFPAS